MISMDAKHYSLITSSSQ